MAEIIEFPEGGKQATVLETQIEQLIERLNHAKNICKQSQLAAATYLYESGSTHDVEHTVADLAFQNLEVGS